MLATGPHRNRIQGRTESWLSTSFIVPWKPRCLAAKGSCGNLALCQLWGCVKPCWPSVIGSCGNPAIAGCAGSRKDLALCWQLGLFEDTALYQLKGYGNPALCLPQSHVETRFCVSFWVAWRPGSVPVKRSSGNPAVCQLQDRRETQLCVDYGVLWKPFYEFPWKSGSEQVEILVRGEFLYNVW